jgi:hypothetical protein
MTAKDAVLDLLKHQKKQLAANKSESGAAALEDWTKALDQLMTKITAWLKEAEGANLLRLETYSATLEEERFGGKPYAAPALKVVTPGGLTVRITPAARFVVGANGRVDLECAPKKAVLVRKDRNHWQFARLAPQAGGWRFDDLNEDSFWQILGELLS